MLLKIGDKGPDVTKLQHGLVLLGFPCGKIDGDFGTKTEDAVESFQASKNLYTDGKAGPLTLEKYNDALRFVVGGTQWVISLPPPQTEIDNPLKKDRSWVTVFCDKVVKSGGYAKMTIRDDAAVDYDKLYKQTHLLGGLITSAGGRRSLSAEVNSNRSSTSMHYTGRAFDMATDTGMQNPSKDQYLVALDPDGNGRQWIVWCKSSMNSDDLYAAAGLAGTEGGLMSINACVATKQGPVYKPTMAAVFNFTK
ncbi:MAG: peptidoglycan-binding domain-containing protein, partial [Bacteroidota bacterium]